VADGVSVLRSVEYFDTRHPKGGWVQMRPLNHPREGAAAVTLDGSVYVIGGHDGTSYLSSVEVWSPSRNGGQHLDISDTHWRPVSSLVQPRSSLAAVAVGNALVALGGYCGRGGSRLASNEMWQPKGRDPKGGGARSQWRFINGMSCPRSDHAAVAAPDLVHTASRPHLHVL
jgi:kelch-like protein 18